MIHLHSLYLNFTCFLILLQAMPDGGLEFEIPYPFEKHTTGTGSNTNSMARRMPPINCDFHTIILECSSWSFIDIVGMNTLMSVSRLNS